MREPHHVSRLAAVPFALVLLAQASTAAATIDLTGTWLAPHSDTGFAEIVHTGTDVTLTWTESSLPVEFVGTFDQTDLEADFATWHLRLNAHDGGDLLIGFSHPGGFDVDPRFLSRCECVDGNSTDGDGCDSQCRIEECYTCSGQPSVCAPSLDGASCDDRSDCTTGETCSAGVCGAGAPISPCIDLSGPWRLYVDGPADWQPYSTDLRVVQRGGVLLHYEEDAAPADAPIAFGSIDPATGEMAYQSMYSNILCTSRVFDGTAAADGNTFEGTLDHRFASPPAICSSYPSGARGVRCDALLGCDLSDCTGHPDGTPCDDADLCTNREECLAGQCLVRSTCALCDYCESGSGTCYAGPAPDCLRSIASNKSQLSLADSFKPGRDRIRWKWKRGEETFPEDYGNPAVLGEMALCLYLGDSLLPTEVSEIALDDDCTDPPCWKEKPTRASFKGETASLLLRAGDDGAATAVFKASGDLPSALAPPYTPSITPVTQLRLSNGACFEVDLLDIKRNQPGKFKAKGGAAE